MRRVLALGLGALAGVVTLRLIRRRRARHTDAGDATEQTDDSADDERASELRRKLDEARERGGDSVGPATVEEGADSEEVASDATSEPDTADLANGGGVVTTGLAATELADKRARVHERARDAAESMRDGGDSGAA